MTTESQTKFGKYLSACQKIAGVSNTDLSKASGMAGITIYRLKTGETAPTLERAVRIGKALGMPEELFVLAALDNQSLSSSDPRVDQLDQLVTAYMEIEEEIALIIQDWRKSR